VRILVYGSRTLGAVVRILVEDCGHEFSGFVDDIHEGPDVLGSFDSVIGTHPPGQYGCVNAVGYRDLTARLRVTSMVLAAGYMMPALVHPRAYVSRTSQIGEGCIVMSGALVDCHVDVGPGVVIWPGANISHDSIVGENTFLSPNSTVCGCCRIGASCFVGAGAVVVDHATVPPGARIKVLERYVTPRK
jgi:sugar O-acyltransferase (sialic acid O-acetyltransferase NeuD family)